MGKHAWKISPQIQGLNANFGFLYLVSQTHLVISLDFELHWGRFDKYSLEHYKSYYQNTRNVIPRILDLFERYQIKATWATVGMLMCKNREEWDYYKPFNLPSFTNDKFSAYNWMENQAQVWDPGVFAPDLVERIKDTPGQELGSHSFAHYYTMEKGQSQEQWKADLVAAKRIAKEKFGLDLESLVFPRNQFSKQAIKSAQEVGFSVFRTNPKDWFWMNVEKENLIKKVFRTGDSLIPLGHKSSYASVENFRGAALIPASRILRPYRSGSLFNQMRINRIKGELDSAIEHGEIYHLWWHPHNFGNYPTENLEVLEDLLQWVNEKVQTGNLCSESMLSLSKKTPLQSEKIIT